jgi:hypothetical protein
MKQQLYLCSCHSPEHQMIFVPTDPDEERTIFVRVNLVKKPFWYRLKHGIKYIFGYQSQYGAFDEMILGPEHSKQLLETSIYLDPDGHTQYLEDVYRVWNGIF